MRSCSKQREHRLQRLWGGGSVVRGGSKEGHGDKESGPFPISNGKGECVCVCACVHAHVLIGFVFRGHSG